MSSDPFWKFVENLNFTQVFITKLSNRVNDRDLVKLLVFQRVEADIPQQEVARKLKWSQSKVSRFEASIDKDLKVGDIKKYLTVLGKSISITIEQKD